MLLTLSQPIRTELGGGSIGSFRASSIHDFPPRNLLATRSRLSPKPDKVDSPVSSLHVSPAAVGATSGCATPTAGGIMATPHRGLPPPSAMGLPDPSRPPPPQLSHHHIIGAMPAPPAQWQGQEESMRNWLVAKAEEDRRRQEEERTKQESYRLEQRRIEQAMLRESLQAGMPPSMVPIIYAGLGGQSLVNISLDWLQQYAAQLQAASQHQIQQQQQQSPDALREARHVGQLPPIQHAAPPPPLPMQQQQQAPQVFASHPVDQVSQPVPLQATFSAYQPAQPRPPPTSIPRSIVQSQLPRLTTNEMYAQQQQQQPQQPALPSQPAAQEQTTASPSIYFHHWVPPAESSGTSSKAAAPQTPAKQPSGGEPSSAAAPGSGSLASDAGDYRESPRKRKATGSHQPAPPPPTSGLGHTSPSYSTTSSTSGGRRGGHGRSRSIASIKEGESFAAASRRESDVQPPYQQQQQQQQRSRQPPPPPPPPGPAEPSPQSGHVSSGSLPTRDETSRRSSAEGPRSTRLDELPPPFDTRAHR